MKITELIAKLEKLKEERGDADVYVNNNWGVPKLGCNSVCESVNAIYHTSCMHDKHYQSRTGVLIE